MMRKYFGTDGIRGRANVAPMTAEMAMRLGMAAGAWFRRGAHRHRAVIGKDTRLSGYMLESALQAGFTSVGVDVILTGPMPTPAVGVFTRSLRADVGVMISASHNPYDDNGLKLFGPDGYKLSDEAEAEIEAMMDAPGALAPAEQIGRAWRVDDLGRYIELAKATFPRALGLEGLKIVVDCANGAAYKAAPMALWELGADVVPIGVAPDGLNINRGVGSTAPQVAQETVVLHGADLGVALDGDADRVHLIDENGALIDGDQIMALIARRWSRQGRLARNGLVTTVMSNLGMERLLAEEGVFTERTKVGDRYVVERMREGGFNLGGEQSGHIVLSDYTTTGDGLIAALQVLAALVEEGRPASEACRQFEPMPQVLKSVRFAGDDPLARERVKTAVADGEAALGDAGRIVIRRSGTEPLIRVMAEGEDEAAVATAVNAICAEIETGA